MIRRPRLWRLLLLGVAAISLILLAAGLADLDFAPGGPGPPREQAEESDPGGLKAPRADSFDALVLPLALTLILLLFYLAVYVLVQPRDRRRRLLLLGLLLAVLSYLLLSGSSETEPPPQVAATASPGPAPTAPATPLPTAGALPAAELAYDPPPWLVLLTAGGLALLTAGVLVGAGWLLWRFRRPPSPLAQLAEEAQHALDALQAGADVKNAVTRCYFDMSRILSRQRGLRRDESMTPREFERRLKAAGLPETSVEQLTRLFETVRYGTRAPTEQEEAQAVACLTAIVQASRSTP